MNASLCLFVYMDDEAGVELRAPGVLARLRLASLPRVFLLLMLSVLIAVLGDDDVVSLETDRLLP